MGIAHTSILYNTAMHVPATLSSNLGNLYNKAANAPSGSLGTTIWNIFLSVAGDAHVVFNIMLIVGIVVAVVHYLRGAILGQNGDEHIRAGHRGVVYVVVAMLIFGFAGSLLGAIH